MQQQRETAAERVDPGLPVELHRLFLGFCLLLLYFFWMSLTLGWIACMGCMRLDLLDAERQQDKRMMTRQDDDRQTP